MRDSQSYEQTYRLIQQLASPFTEQVRAAARASRNAEGRRGQGGPDGG